MIHCYLSCGPIRSRSNHVALSVSNRMNDLVHVTMHDRGMVRYIDKIELTALGRVFASQARQCLRRWVARFRRFFLVLQMTCLALLAAVRRPILPSSGRPLWWHYGQTLSGYVG